MGLTGFSMDFNGLSLEFSSGGFKHYSYFPFHIWDVILPIDEVHHSSRWVGIPPTRSSMNYKIPIHQPGFMGMTWFSKTLVAWWLCVKTIEDYIIITLW